MVSVMCHICDSTYTERDEADDAVDGRVRAFPDRRQTNYPQTINTTPSYPQDGGELPSSKFHGVHDPMVPVAFRRHRGVPGAGAEDQAGEGVARQ